MRFVIAGGTGFIGQALIEDLMIDGHTVTLLSRNPETYRSTLPGKVNFVYWDGKQVGDWLQTIEGVDVVINFAGENLGGDGFFPNRWSREKKRRIRQSRIDSGRTIVEAIRRVENKPGVLVQASAIGYYGPRGNEMITEAASPGADFLASICVEWEAATEEVETLGVRRVLTRTGLVLTRAGGPLSRLVPLYKLYVGGYFGNGKQWWSWIHLDDVIKANRFLIANDQAKGPFNLIAPNPVTAREFGKALGRAMGKPSYMPVPGFAMKLMVGEVATVVLDGQRAIPEKLQALGYPFQYNELDQAFSELFSK